MLEKLIRLAGSAAFWCFIVVTANMRADAYFQAGGSAGGAYSNTKDAPAQHIGDAGYSYSERGSGFNPGWLGLLGVLGLVGLVRPRREA